MAVSKSKQQAATITQDPEEIVPRAVLAQSIKSISASMEKLLSGGLNERAITCLVHELSGVGKPDIRSVLASLRTLEKEYCRG
jgi:hypothetical protein